MVARVSRWANLASLLVVLVASIPPLVWFGNHWMIFIDSAEYLLLGGNLASGEGYTHSENDIPVTKRGPVFPGLISLLILVFGRDVESLAWGVRLLALANPLLAYFLVKRLCGSIAGLLAAALVSLFGYTATMTEAFNIDTALLTVYLLAVIAVLVAAQRDDRFSLALLSGLLLGTSILTKETSFTNLPLALFAGLLLSWNPRGVSLHYLGVMLVCLPWWAWVWYVNNEIYLVGKLPAALHVPVVAAIVASLGIAVGLYISGLPTRFLASARRRQWTGWALVIAWITIMSILLLTTSVALGDSSLAIVRRFVFGRLTAYTPLWPLLLVAGGYIVWKAARGYGLWKFYTAALALQVPVCLLAAVEGWSLRQFLIPQTLLLCALAVLVVETYEAAGRQGVRRWWAVLAAASLTAILALSAATQVRTLLGEPEDWSSFDRTSRVSKTSVAAVSAVQDMHGWIAENVPDEERVVHSVFHSNYLIFLSGEQEKWVGLRLDCEFGRRNPTTIGCVPSETIAESPPGPTIWFHMERDCRAVALSMPTLMEQLEHSDSDYLLLSTSPKYPALLGSARHLADSGAFEVSHVERRAVRQPYEHDMAVYLLERTGEAPAAEPTQMDAETVNNLARCEATADNGYAQAIRSKFPNGIALEPAPSRSQNPHDEARVAAEAREVIRDVYAAG